MLPGGLGGDHAMPPRAAEAFDRRQGGLVMGCVGSVAESAAF